MGIPDTGRGVRLIRLDAHDWEDALGWGLRPFEAAGSDVGHVGDVHVVSLLPGAVRGNHRHPNVTVWVLLLGAPVTVAWRNPDGTEERVRAEGEEPLLLELPPGTSHAMRAEGTAPAYLVSWADGVPETETVAPLL
jgi:quercetin dioxygenase-like cupin family protein